MPENNALMLGELRGQMREMIHSMNNLLVKFDSLSREVAGLGPIAADIIELKASISAAQVRLNALEMEKHRTDGAKNLGGLLLKSPVAGWAVGAVVSAWAIITGRLHL